LIQTLSHSDIRRSMLDHKVRHPRCVHKLTRVERMYLFNTALFEGRGIYRWAGHVARLGEERGCTASCWGNRREGDHWGDLGIDGWIVL